MKLLVLTIEAFQDIELVAFCSIMKASGKFETIDFYNAEGQSEITGQFDVANIKTKTTYDVNNYDMLYVPGGVGAINLRKLPNAQKCIADFFAHDKWVVSICDSPNAMAEKGLLKADDKYISWSDGTMNDKRRITNLTVNVNKTKKFITGRNSLQTLELAFFTIETLFGTEFAYELKAALSGI